MGKRTISWALNYSRTKVRDTKKESRNGVTAFRLSLLLMNLQEIDFQLFKLLKAANILKGRSLLNTTTVVF